MHVSAIIAAGGQGSRFGADRPKQLLAIGGRPILQHAFDALVGSPLITDVVVAVPADIAVDPPAYLRTPAKPTVVVEGGSRRQDSVARAFARIPTTADVVLIHDAARPFVSRDLVARTVEAAIAHGAAIAALQATDTVKRGNAGRVIVGTLSRDEVFLAQTPQAFRIGILRDALALARANADATDEAMLAEQAGHHVHLVEGDPRNLKITTPADLEIARQLMAVPGTTAGLRIGNGYDLHRLVTGRPLVLGGVTIPFERGLQGHSDADAVCHAVTDAILGAAAAGDIGRHFPDTDSAWKDANSIALLASAVGIVRTMGYGVANVDVVVIAQQPRLLHHVDAMRDNLARAIGIPVQHVSVKGKTNEGVDATGAGDAIAVHAVVLVHNL